MTNFIKRIFKLFFGIFLFALGIVMTLKANIGFAPWDVLHQGIANTIGITFGQVSILVGLIICVISIFLGEKFGIGTILNIILIGLLIDIILLLNIIPQMNKYISSIILMTVGLFTIAFATYFYIDSGFCAGPRDALMVAIEKKLVWLLGSPEEYLK